MRTFVGASGGWGEGGEGKERVDAVVRSSIAQARIRGVVSYMNGPRSGN